MAAVVNGALGYGFSSITLPAGLLIVPSRMLNPALVALEVPLNAYVLWATRRQAGATWRLVWPVIAGLAPGILVGTLLLQRLDGGVLRFLVYATLLPLTLLQIAGVRRPLRLDRATGLAMGGGGGTLYAATTISGPPLAVFLGNQGLVQAEFRASLGWIRLAESSLTAVAYWWTGLFTPSSLSLLPWLVPAVAIGLPAGATLIRGCRAGAVPTRVHERRRAPRRVRALARVAGARVDR